MKEVLRALNQKPIAYYPIYRKIAGSTTAGILLSQLMYWFSFKDKFYKTDKEIIEETQLSEKELRNAKIKIKKLSFIKVSLEGVPAKTYYKIDWDLYYLAVEEIAKKEVAERDNTDTPKGQNSTSPKGNTVLAERAELLLENTTKITTKNTTKEKIYKKEKFEVLKKLILDGLKASKLLSFKDKVNISTCKKDLKDLDLSIDDLDLEELASAYVDYISANRNYAVRLNKFIIAYIEGNLSDLNSQPIPNYTQDNRNGNLAQMNVRETVNMFEIVDKMFEAREKLKNKDNDYTIETEVLDDENNY